MCRAHTSLHRVGEAFELPIFAPSKGCQLEFSFRELSGYTLDFSVSQVGVGQLLGRSSVDVSKGACELPNDGPCTLRWDNTKSWMYGREIAYEAVLRVEAEDEVEAVKRVLARNKRKYRRPRSFPCCCLSTLEAAQGSEEEGYGLTR